MNSEHPLQNRKKITQSLPRHCKPLLPLLKWLWNEKENNNKNGVSFSEYYGVPLHSSIYFWVVRLRFVQVGFICVWFDSFLRRLIDSCTKCIYLHVVQFIFAWFNWVFAVLTSCGRSLFYLSVINYHNVCTCFIWTLDILAVTEHHRVSFFVLEILSFFCIMQIRKLMTS